MTPLSVHEMYNYFKRRTHKNTPCNFRDPKTRDEERALGTRSETIAEDLATRV
jgi:hypothetical protein